MQFHPCPMLGLLSPDPFVTAQMSLPLPSVRLSRCAILGAYIP